jgi:class 3 adenylate cyclase
MSSERRQENKFIVYTDIIGHTKMFGRVGASFRQMRERHDELFNLAVKGHAPGAVVKGTGDGFYAAMDDVSAAIETAIAFQQGLANEDWNRLLPADKKTPDNHIKCRIGVHSGMVRVFYEDGRGVDFDGQPRSITEKVMSMAGANQVLLSRQVRDQVMVNMARRDEIRLKKFGEFKLREVPDTVEIWGAAEDEAAIGPRPVQPPEHRVIVFVTIADYAQVFESGGPKFDEAKDVWDRVFEQVVAEHAQEAFTKRLPDGSLGAFKSATEAIRVARDLRRQLKLAARDLPVALAPKVGVDSGLVTFDYENNRAVDVRDQPVNIAAKICKAEKPVLCAPWQLLLTRPVREDAYSNLKERDEFKWVCLGRKPVPGEPEPVELWDFIDSQTKSEPRTVLWIDAKAVRLAAMRGDPKNWTAFTRRLGELLDEVLVDRAERPWILPMETGLAAAFSNPVEAVKAADQLAIKSKAEPWERFPTGYKRSGREDNLLRLGLSLGPIRVTYEDGQIKEIKGEAVDAVKPVTDSGKNGQILLSREVMDAVAGAFPETEVNWKPAEKRKDGPAVEAFLFQRVSAKHRSLKPMLIGGGIAAVPALAGIIFLGMYLRGRDDASNRRPGEVKVFIGKWERQAEEKDDAVLKALTARLGELLKAKDLALTNDAWERERRDKALKFELEPVEKYLGAWETYNTKAIGADQLKALEGFSNVEQITDWIGKLENYKRLPEETNPISVAKLDEWRAQIKAFEKDLGIYKLRDSEIAKQVAEMAKRVEAAAELRKLWVEARKEDIERERREIDAAINPVGTLTVEVTGAFQKAEDSDSELREKRSRETKQAAQERAAKSGLPEEVLFTLYDAQARSLTMFKTLGSKSLEVIDAMKETGPQREAIVRPLAESIKKLLDEQKDYDLLGASAQAMPALEKATTIRDLQAWVRGLEEYRKLTDPDPRDTFAWRKAIDEFQIKLRGQGVKNEQLDAEIKALSDRIDEVEKARWIKPTQAEVTKASQEIAAAVAETGPLGQRVSGAIAAAQAEAAARRDELLKGSEAAAKAEQALTRATVDGVSEPAINDLWKTRRDALNVALKDKSKTPQQVIDESTAWQNALKPLPAIFPSPAPVPADAPRWKRELGVAAAKDRDEAIAAFARGVEASAAPETLAPAAQQAASALAAKLATYDTFAAAVSSLGTALDQAWLPADQVPGVGKTVAELAAAVNAHPLAKQPAVAEGIKDVTNRLSALESVQKATSAAELAKAARDARASTPELVLAAWNRLGEVEGAAEPAWLDAQREAGERLLQLREPLTPERREAFKQLVAAGKPARWIKHVEALTTEPALRSAIAKQGDFGVDDSKLSGLNPTGRHNYRLALLKGVLREPDSPEKEKNAEAAGAALIDAAKGAPLDERTRQAVDLLKQVLDGKQVQFAAAAPAEATPDQMGPALAGWKVVAQQADSVTYEFELAEGKKWYCDGTPPRLEFIRLNVNDASGGRTVYLSTTAISVRTFFEVVDKAGTWRGLQGFYNRQEWGDMNTPGTWSPPDSTSRQELRLGLGRDKNLGSDDKSQITWVKTRTVAEKNVARYYPTGLNVPPPTFDSPIQYVTPAMALYVARSMGARLPSSGEWQAALAMDGIGSPADYNLRDQALKPLIDYWATNKITGLNPPDTGAFRKPPAAKSGEVFPHNDGYVFFAPANTPVKPGKRFVHLIGNVAQLVYENPAEIDNLPAGEAQSFIENNLGQFGVIGGSALGEVADLTKFQQPIMIPKGNKNAKDFGWSDVGFRVAFSPSKPAPVGEQSRTDRIAEAARDIAYLGARAQSGGK